MRALLLVLALVWSSQSDCPRRCRCRWDPYEKIARCSRSNCTSLQMNLVQDTKVLDLSDNPLVTINDYDFAHLSVWNLQQLNLSRCQLQTIAPLAFATLGNLEYLDLSHNNLVALDDSWFHPTRYLQHLFLHGNRITLLRNYIFLNLQRLTDLSLKNNKISKIESQAFTGLQLERLELNRNKLRMVRVEVFKWCKSLRHLELADNPWHCTCPLVPLRDWTIRRNITWSVAPLCMSPPRLTSQSWIRIDEEEACGVRLVCEVRGGVRWSHEGRLLADITEAKRRARKLYTNEKSIFTMASAELSEKELILDFAVENKTKHKKSRGEL